VINYLRTAKSAYFYKARRNKLPRSAIEDAFRAVRSQAPEASSPLFREIKKQHQNAVWSALAFFYDREPAFLDLPAGRKKERVCGYLLLIEYREHIALFKAGLDLPLAFRRTHTRPVEDERIEVALAQANATFEQIRLRSMSASKYALRSKTLEADDLQNVIPPSGSHRYIPRGYRTRNGNEYYAVTVNTGRVSLRSERVSYDELIEWSSLVIDRCVDTQNPSSAFIRQFARPIDLANIPSGVTPILFSLDVARLKEHLLEESSTLLLARAKDNKIEPFTLQEAKDALSALENTLHIKQSGAYLNLYEDPPTSPIGRIKLNQSRIALRALEWVNADTLYVVPRVPEPGADELPLALKRYIDQNNLFTILFSDPSIVYLEGSLYRDRSLVEGGEAFLKYFHPAVSLSVTSSEKGQFTQGQTEFSADSVFRVVVDKLTSDDDILVCDDLGDEWADFIGVSTGNTPKTISFYHAKYGETSLGASGFHVAVGQAIKNLGRLNMSKAAIEDRVKGKWSETYRGENSDTSIVRTIRGGRSILTDIERVATSPDTIRRVFLVTPTLSYKRLEDEFKDISKGKRPQAHFVQLYWLLNSLFSACIEVGVFPYVSCAE
jgi:hypothetical protein